MTTCIQTFKKRENYTYYIRDNWEDLLFKYDLDKSMKNYKVEYYNIPPQNDELFEITNVPFSAVVFSTENAVGVHLDLLLDILFEAVAESSFVDW